MIVFLIWLWISNIAVLLGAELNAELERGRELEGGRAGGARRSQLEPRERSQATSAVAVRPGAGAGPAAPAAGIDARCRSGSRAGSPTTP